MYTLFIKEINGFFSSLIGYVVIIVFLLANSLFMWVFPGEFNVLDSGYANIRSSSLKYAPSLVCSFWQVFTFQLECSLRQLLKTRLLPLLLLWQFHFYFLLVLNQLAL